MLAFSVNVEKGKEFFKKIVSQYYYKSLSRKIISISFIWLFLWNVNSITSLPTIPAQVVGKIYPTSDWDSLPYWVKVLGIFTLCNFTFLRSLHFGGTYLKMSGYCVRFSEQNTLLLIYLTKALEISINFGSFFVRNFDNFKVCCFLKRYSKFSEYNTGED